MRQLTSTVRLWMVAAGLLCTCFLFQPVPASAGTFSNSSLSGSFGFQLNKFGTCPNIAVATGLFNFDGLTPGGVTGTATQYDSDKGGTGPKVLAAKLVSGSYNVATDGTGTISLTSPQTLSFAFVIDSTSTSAERIELINTSSHSWTCAMSGYAIQQ
jgi:hypothetical protein